MRTKHLGRFEICAWAMYSGGSWIGYWQVRSPAKSERTAICSNDSGALTEASALHHAFVEALDHCTISLELGAIERAKRIGREPS